MGIDHLLVMGVGLAILVVFSAVFVEYISPMFSKAHFDEICRDYVLRAEAENGLSSSDRKSLEEKLEKMGLENIEIDITEINSVARRSVMKISIKCHYIFNAIVDLGSRKEKDLVFSFERHFMARRIVE